ncbi:FAD/NAD(P)-dependent oxidoreductase [Streptomyces albogriseolus]|uniref:FAD/NAD(P)-dependent oxidoreductase n=1 Tax=Streptomyces albogriseolus TaxID=1887 RepID=UPI00380111B2
MRTDLAVIGAGPAGLAAALAAARRGIRVALVDAAPRPGGQYFRQPAPGLGTEGAVPRHGRRTWTRLRAALAESAVDVRPEHHVWCVERESGGLTVHALLGPEQRESVDVRAHAVLLATGGYETVLPFPGWTLPGVVTAGGAQAMLKGGLVTPGRTAVVAGTGPLLLPVATGLAAAGVRVAALVESTDPARLPRHARALAGKLPEAAGYAARLLRHRVPVLTRHTVVRAHGEDRLTGVTVAALDAGGRVRPGTERLLPCDALAVGHGMLPHTDLAETLGCRLDGHAVAVDAEQRTDVPGVWAAGEATGIGGAALALAEGHIAGRSVAARLRGTAPDPHDWAPAARIRARERTTAATLHALHGPPAHWSDGVPDDTVLCRCEEVTAGAVREALTLGAGDTRTVKLLTRAGMGWCQGRMCAPGVAALTGCPPTPSRRPFARPVPLGVLAARHDRPTPHDHPHPRSEEGPS